MSEPMVPRRLRVHLEDRLRLFPPVALLGPRQVGKTTLARTIAESGLEGEASSERKEASFYRTATGVEVDLVLELPGNRLWAIEIKSGLAPSIGRGLRVALDDLKPDRAFTVYGGQDRYPMGDGLEAIGLRALAEELASG